MLEHELLVCQQGPSACAQYAPFAIELSWKMLVKEGEKKDDGMKMNATLPWRARARGNDDE